MALSAKMGSFIRPGGTIDQSHTGFGFAPKAVLFFGNGQTADGAVGSGSGGAEYPMYLGLMDSADAKCYPNSDDFTAGGPGIEPTSCIYLISNGSGGENAKADLVSLDADGFTVHWYNIDQANIVNYLALGGSDLTNAKLVSCGTIPQVTGNASITGVGFKPDAIIFIAGRSSAYDRGGMGFAVSSSQRGTNATVYDGTAGTQKYERTDKALSVLTAGVTHEADLVSMDADGFTLNWTTVASQGANQPSFYALCLKGGSYKVGAITEATTNTTKAETGVGFQPKAVLFSTVGKTAGTTVAGGLQGQGYGAAVSTSSRAAVGTYDNAQISTRLDRTKCLVFPLDSGGASPTSGGAADLASMDSDGFTLSWTSTDGTARESLYMAFGDASAAAAFPTTAIIDNFNRADGNLNTRLACSDGINSWFLGKINGSTDTAFDIVSNQLKDNATTADSFISASFGPDCEAYVSVPTLPTSYAFIAARVKDENTATWDGYGVIYIIGTGWQIRRYDNGASTVLASNGAGLSAGDKIGMSVIGSVITAYRYTAGAWAVLFSTTDTTYPAAGKIGLEVGDATARLDDFGGGKVTTQNILPDADTITTGWATAPLFSKVNDASDASVISATAS